MLQFIRDQASGWIAWVIVILICIPFALWGLHQFQGGGQSQAVANVNGSEIGVSAFQQAYQSQRRQLQQIFGGKLPSLYNEDRLRKDTLEQMVNDELILQAGINIGLRVGDRQLFESIQSLPILKSSTGFSNDQYQTFLQSRGLTAAGFEADMRRSILTQQLVTGIRSTAIATRSEIARALKLSNEKRRFIHFQITPSAKDVPIVGEEKLRNYFATHKQEYVIPEQVKIDYVELSRQSIAKNIIVDEQALHRLYENNRANYATTAQREVRHILIQVDKDADEATVKAAQEKIQALANRISQGESFADIAKANSDDPGSAANGGSLGFFGKGVMDPAFEKAAFSLPENQLSDPVRSSFGWHLIEVTGIQGEQSKPFEEVRDGLVQSYRAAQAEEIFAEQVDQLATLAFEQPESLQPVADALGIEIIHSEYFSSDGVRGNRVLSNSRVLSAVFAPDFKSSGANSELLELDSNTVVVVRIVGQLDPKPQSFADVREEINVVLKQEAAAAQAAALGKQILSELKNGAERQQIAEKNGLKWSAEQSLTRRSQGSASPRLLAQLFKMPRPTQYSPTYAGLQESGGGYTIIALLAVESAKKGDEGALDKNNITQSLRSSLGEQAFSAVVKSLRDDSDIQIFMENLSTSEGF